jgi:formamidopyrimidine-DNA glycosylase
VIELPEAVTLARQVTESLHGARVETVVAGASPRDFDAARRAPSPLSDGFDRAYFGRLACAPAVQKLSVKGLLATEQRFPGIGNGVPQDILHGARLHPRRKVATLTSDERDRLFGAITATLAQMARLGGRDTERDLHGRPGGYATRLSRNTLGQPCGACGALIVKETFLGGSVYLCPECQRDDRQGRPSVPR